MKILAVCGFGVGSSMVLKMSIQKALKDMNLEATVENTDLSSARGMNVDVIFTSKELLEELQKSTTIPIYSIKKYMDKEEIKLALKDFIEKSKK